jgi:hypothetical protein
MADITGTTRAQTKFLRACTSDPWGLTGRDWPNAVTFRRWMRRQTFRKAVKSIRDALRFQADLHLTAASAVAAQTLSESIQSPPADEEKLARQRDQLKDLITLLKLVHARERFTAPREPAEPAPRPRRNERDIVVEYLQRDQVKPHYTVANVLHHIKVAEAMERRAAAEPDAGARRAA